MSLAHQQLSKSDASKIIQSKDIETLSKVQLLKLFQDENFPRVAPTDFGRFDLDPRSGEGVLFNPARATRPNAHSDSKSTGECPICEGKTTEIIDYQELSNGFTFVNKNMFPAVYPHPAINSSQGISGSPVWGLHSLQWTSSLHDLDWHNMEISDLAIAMKRLGTIEKHLPAEFTEHISKIDGQLTGKNPGHVSIIKNGGLGSGGSLAHGHQQIIYSNIIPRRALDNLSFLEKHSLVFSQYIMDETPESLIIQDLGEAILLVPFFMRRPYNMLLVVKDTRRKFIHQLTTSELIAVSKGWKIAIQLIHQIMQERNQSISYNVITHNGLGAGLYFEFLPRTQTEGGFELIGLSVCQSIPEIAADQLRKIGTG